MQGLGSIIASPSLFVTPHKDLTQTTSKPIFSLLKHIPTFEE